MATRRRRQNRRNAPKPEATEMPSLLTAALDEATQDEAAQTPHQRAQAQMRARMDQMDKQAQEKANQKEDPRLIPKNLRRVLAD